MSKFALYLLQHHSWQILSGQTEDHSRQIAVFSLLCIWISQGRCLYLPRGLDHIYEPKPNAEKDVNINHHELLICMFSFVSLLNTIIIELITIWTNLNPLHQRILCASFNELAQWLWSMRFLKVVNLVLVFHNYLP